MRSTGVSNGNVAQCKECGQTFLNWKEFDAHVNRHLQKYLDTPFLGNTKLKKIRYILGVIERQVQDFVEDACKDCIKSKQSCLFFDTAEAYQDQAHVLVPDHSWSGEYHGASLSQTFNFYDRVLLTSLFIFCSEILIVFRSLYIVTSGLRFYSSGVRALLRPVSL